MDWVRFLEENNVHFVTRGPNTKRGEVSIQCPMCGEDDPSEHLGINLTTGNWGCHRDPSHRGKSARTLIKALVGCSSSQAWQIVRQYDHSDPDTLEAALSALEGNSYLDSGKDLQGQIQSQCLEPEFWDFSLIKPRGVTKRFFQYLQNRGFDNPQDLTERYELRCALTGRYKDRIIIPVSLGDELLGWTARAIGVVRDAPRYLASSTKVKATVFNYDELKAGGKRLFIVEGPFDAIRMDNWALVNTPADGMYSPKDDEGYVQFRATCTFGTSPTIPQIALLRSLVKKYDEAYVLFDHGADGPAEDLAAWIGAKRAYLPSQVEDPGDLKDRHIEHYAKTSFSGRYSYWDWWNTAMKTTIKNRHKTLTQGLAQPLYGKRKP